MPNVTTTGLIEVTGSAAATTRPIGVSAETHIPTAGDVDTKIATAIDGIYADSPPYEPLMMRDTFTRANTAEDDELGAIEEGEYIGGLWEHDSDPTHDSIVILDGDLAVTVGASWDYHEARTVSDIPGSVTAVMELTKDLSNQYGSPSILLRNDTNNALVCYFSVHAQEIRIAQKVSWTTTVLATQAKTLAAGPKFIKFSLVEWDSDYILRAKAWMATDDEPGIWDIEYVLTSPSALLASGAVGVQLRGLDKARIGSVEVFTADYINDSFNNFALTDNDAGALWASKFVGWNVRSLVGNSDDGYKLYDEWPLTGGGGDTVADYLLTANGGAYGAAPYLHPASKGSLKLRTYPVDSGDEALFDGYPYIGSMISSEPLGGFTFGTVEAKLRFNNLPTGHHFSLWLISATSEYPPEIDILEVVGSNPTDFTCNDHADLAPNQTHYTRPGAAGDWYTFKFVWSPARTSWYCDDVLVRQTKNYQTEFFDNPLVLLATWEIASEWPGDPDGSTVWPGDVEFEYIKISGVY